MPAMYCIFKLSPKLKSVLVVVIAEGVNQNPTESCPADPVKTVLSANSKNEVSGMLTADRDWETA